MTMKWSSVVSVSLGLALLGAPVTAMASGVGNAFNKAKEKIETDTNKAQKTIKTDTKKVESTIKKDLHHNKKTVKKGK